MAKATDVSYSTIWLAARGKQLDSYSVAKRISDYTGGVVTIESLCEGVEKKTA